jgi:pimeloyl-ACP methyl ester carboxylesterase/class 3 adenylate cyclase
MPVSGTARSPLVKPDAVLEAPDVRYARSGDVNIAYGVIGDGPIDLVFVNGWVFSTHELAWDGPAGDFLRALARFGRLILFDKRGTGLSDRANGIADLETRMDDIRAVMDAVGSRRAAVIGVSEGGPMTLMFAATYPERTAAAIVYGSSVSFVKSEDYPWALTPNEWRRVIDELAHAGETTAWLDERLAEEAPSRATDGEVVRWWRRWVRTSASPGAIIDLWRMNMEIDARHLLPTIHLPTLVLHRLGDVVYPSAQSRYIAERLPNAELVELPGDDHAWWVEPDAIAGAIEEFLREIWDSGDWDVVESDRVLATVLFTDIVGSTAKAVSLGDAAWRELLQRHHAIVRRQLVRFRGRELDTAGDGFFASFDGPARAVRCACAITTALEAVGLDIRAGLHTGECELVEGKVGGIAVHIGARVASEAAPGEVLVSSTVRDLVAGSGLRFHDRGAAQLNGLPEEWKLYAVER